MLKLSSHWTLALLLCLALLPASTRAVEPTAENAKRAEQHFATRVLPLLERKCLACHGREPDDLKGQFDMRSRARLLRGGESGEAALVPGKPQQSLLMHAVRWETIEMPPKENDRLSEKEIEVLRQWIADGAVWPDEERIRELADSDWQGGSAEGVTVATSGGLSEAWTHRRYDPADLWAYRPLQRPAVPQQAGGEKHVVDAFLNRQLQAHQLPPAEQAERAALIRRLSYDLTGLPPTPAEIKAFQQNDSPQAWQRLVDRLLASDHYGERIAQHWLDVVRYADTNGFARDDFRPDAWKYRDYVIEAFNADKPFDQFVREQIAGDQLAPPVPEATGFLWMGPWEHTAMSVAAVTRQQWLDDVTNSVGVTFLGHELRCAKCHDHKFDPIPTRDYYRMQAVFAATAHHKQAGQYEIRGQAPQTIHILTGGSLESPAAEVQPGVLSVARPIAITQEKSGRRRELADWLASRDNPLTARVLVNRVWQMHFGRGLVASPNNFGKTGSRPTHPELLDYLADWFMEHDWSVKELHRLIVTSNAYRRSGMPADRELTARVDPDNRLLSYFPVRRLTAEEIRDSLLAITGELNRQTGGASVYPEINWEVAFQPRLLMGKIGAPYQPSSKRAERNRRTLYAVRIRGLRSPMLETFNQPSSELSCERRDQTIVAPQALTMLHGEFFHERALALANQVHKAHEQQAERIEAVFQQVYGRRPSAEEQQWASEHVSAMTRRHEQLPLEPQQLPTKVTLSSVQEKTGEPEFKTFELDNLKQYEQDLKPWDVAPPTRALADLCLVLFNSSEFLYVY